MDEKAEVIIIHETVLEARAAGTVAVFVTLIGIGRLIDSSAMQWMGAIIAFITIWQRALGKVQRLTIAAAREKLDEMERETA